MNKAALIERYVACPECNSPVNFIESNEIYLKCKNCSKKFRIYDNEILMMLNRYEDEDKVFQIKWETAYQTWTNLEEEVRLYYLDDTIRQLLESLPVPIPTGNDAYLEIGCGMGFVGEELAKAGWLFIGVDYSLTALCALKKRLDNRGIDNYLLIYGDIGKMPILPNTVSLVGGFGVIEHLKDPRPALMNIYKSLKIGGKTFNTVPYLNVGNVLYRSVLWGSIPNMPILKQILEFINIRLLKGKRMIFGYELQLSAGQLLKMHRDAGFLDRDISVQKFEVQVKLEFIKIQWLKKICRYLSENCRQFWPMVKVVAVKR